MKEDNHPEVQGNRPAAQDKICREEVCVFKLIVCTLFLFIACFTNQAQAQCLHQNKIFTDGERVNYDVYFKWGLLMPKAGTASMTIKDSRYNNTPAWHIRVLINTSGMVDKVFSIRDTMQNYMTKDNPRLLYSGKRTNEGGYYEMDDLTYTYKDNKTYIHSIRKNKNRVKADTVLIGGECTLDLLGSFMYARSFDWEDLDIGVQYPLEVGMGKSLIKVQYRYEGQRIVERDNVKFSTRLFVIDIYDAAFTESREAMEIWIGDDENHIPVKMRAKLKIGAMEAYYKSSKNLKHPLTSRIEIPKQ